MRRSWLLAVLFSSSLAFAADPRWIRARSPNFEMYSTASEASVRSTLLQFEEVRSFFQTLTSVDVDNAVPVRIVAFNSPKEYDPYRPNEVAIAFYSSGVERDTLVMNHIGADTFPVAIQEYFHLALNHWGLKFLLWMHQGMALLYSTLRSVPGSTVVGDLIPWRVQALVNDKWVPLAVILAVDSHSPYFTEKSKAGSFYNESWALTHMLYLSPEYRPRFPDLLTAIATGKESADALTTVYGKPLKAIEEDLRLYVRGDRFRAAVFPTRLRTANLSIMPEPAPGFDIRLALAELPRKGAKNPADHAAFRQQLEALAAEQPERPEPHAVLGYLILNGPGVEPGKRVPAAIQQEVQKEFGAAFSLGDHSPKMLWDYGRMIETNQPKESEGVFRRLLTIQPDRSEAAVELASAILGEGQPAEALKILNSLPEKMTSGEAPRYYIVSASVSLRLGQSENARSFAQKVLDASKSSVAEKQWAQRFLDNLK